MTTKQDKELLLNDSCARLPYGVIVNIRYSKEHASSLRLRVCSYGILKLNVDVLSLFIEDEIEIKPYLRPMSSMTKEEKYIYSRFSLSRNNTECFDWLNAHHFDYRGLIEKGLAIEAPEGMYETEKQKN